MNVLSGKIVKLRAPEKTDLDILYNWENNTLLWHIGNTLTPFSKHILQKYLDTAHLSLFETQQLRLMIDVISTNNTVGCIDLFDFDPHNNRAGVGILIAEDKDRGNGYASEALQVLIEYSFKILGLHQLYCNIGADNIASLQLFKKHGFEEVGLKKEWAKLGKKWGDEYLLQLLNK
jgi:diamine N-acetyltransferase